MTDRAVSSHPVRLIRMRELPPIVGLKPAMIYRLRALGEFPQPVKLYGRAVAWRSDDIAEWIASRERA